MKRADSQKRKASVVFPQALLETEPGKLKPACSEGNRRVYTSAAAIGLAAMSIGLPNLSLTNGSQAARAAEPVALDPSGIADKVTSKPSSSLAISPIEVEPGTALQPGILTGLESAETEAKVAAPSPRADEVAPAVMKDLVKAELKHQRTAILTPAEPEPVVDSVALEQAEIKDQKQAALDEAVNYVAVLEAADADPSQTLTVLPSGKALPKVESEADAETDFSTLPTIVDTANLVVASSAQSLDVPTASSLTEAGIESNPELSAQLTSPQGITPSVQLTAPEADPIPEKVTVGLYRVQSGDTVEEIAKTQGVDEDALIEVNALDNPDTLEVNQPLTVARFSEEAPVVETPAAEEIELFQSSLTWESANSSEPFSVEPSGEFDGTAQLPVSQPLEAKEVEIESTSAISLTSPDRGLVLKEEVKPLEIGKREEQPVPIASSWNFNPVSSISPQTLHQVRHGETLDAIARRYGVSRTELIQANQISNPNLIQVNQNLKIPAAVTESTTAVTSVIPGINSGNMPNPTAVSSLTAQLLPDTVSAETTQPTVGSATVALNSDRESQSNYSSYVQGLSNEIDRLRQQYESQPEGFNLQQAEPVESAGPSSRSTQRSQRVNPEFAPSTASSNLQEELQRLQQTHRSNPTAPTPQSQTVAVAPLGPNAYDPSQLPIGEMVSPDVPPLAPGERYLPGDRINGYTWPSKGVLTSGYGWRWGRMHKGIDIAGPIGTPIFAAASGVVDYAQWNNGGYGYLVDIRHPDGSLTRYAHNNRILVRKGQRVRQGEQIAEMGSTGYSTGPHLHFEIHAAGQGAVNPIAYLPQR
ncbi:peptidoglycan DD-metalloendopeptidase family protein [Roseofilum casamattae]|uniref:Peptidoglycan DD-metalloendopeptidase family protein n=1 Tax=Roseofilum casamattae BLCC-M143 TaxID=3022442 RepID=A0ABT7BYA5_9CYAN|nr:peptidoglycan DD-metalloendopeptidase family protein [Roseofilum casamattae]MDJ1183787.1 peptidoglycan DD-metalloendopeptidase family protein [Roseofilum casamattae BLCC-M143]